MAKHMKTGKEGEHLALHYLYAQGYEILETNWRFGRAEIDIIARKEEILIFVEVKTRTNEAFGLPEEAVDVRKMRLLTRAAAVYMEKISHEWEVRFDVIAIVMTNGSAANIEHFQDAFFL